MSVKYEEEIYEFLKNEPGALTTRGISVKTGRTSQRVWTALTQLEQKKLIVQRRGLWLRTDELERDDDRA